MSNDTLTSTDEVDMLDDEVARCIDGDATVAAQGVTPAISTIDTAGAIAPLALVAVEC